MGEPVVYASFWQIDELDSADRKNLSFCRLDERASYIIQDTGISVSEEQLETVKELGALAGDFMRVRWLYCSALDSAITLQAQFKLAEDGIIEVPDDQHDLFYLYVKADSLFHTLVSFSRKFIDKAEHYIVKHNGPKSEAYACWKKTVSHGYDNSIVYALMYDLRNCVEHDFWTISLVNVDPKSRSAGFALNVDNGLISLEKLKAKTKERLRKWATERARNDEPAWLSLGKCVETYTNMLNALYSLWFSLMFEKYVEVADRNRGSLCSMPTNAVLWGGSTCKKYSANQQARVYPIAGLGFEEHLRQELQRIDEQINEMLSAQHAADDNK